jgi:hypothetical protein
VRITLRTLVVPRLELGVIICLAKLFAIIFLTSAFAKGTCGGVIITEVFGAKSDAEKIVDVFSNLGNNNERLAFDTAFNFSVGADEGETHCHARANLEVTQFNYHTNFLRSPFICPMEGVTKKLSFAFGTAFNFSVDADEGETQRQARADLEVGDNTNNFPAVEIIDYKTLFPFPLSPQ